MEDEPKSPWPQPFTFGGVARFAHVRAGWLIGCQALVALLAAATVVGFAEANLWPVVRQAISEMPPTGTLRNGVLEWPRGRSVQTGTTFLWITIDPSNLLEPGGGPDFELEFTGTDLRLRSLLGYVAVPYPAGVALALNRNELEPWWGAWRPAITAGLGLAVVLGLFASWYLLALLYAWPARLISFYADRAVSWFGAWRLAAACLLPGALFFTLSIAAYATHRLNLVQLMAAAVLHFMVGWVYVLGTPFCLPRASSGPAAKKGNPFRPPRSKISPDRKRPNPFASGQEPEE